MFYTLFSSPIIITFLARYETQLIKKSCLYIEKIKKDMKNDNNKADKFVETIKEIRIV